MSHYRNTLIAHAIDDVVNDLGGVGSPVSHDGDDTDFLLAKVIDCNIYTCAALFGNNGVISEDIVTDGRIIRVRGRRGNLNNAVLLINWSCCHTYAGSEMSDHTCNVVFVGYDLLCNGSCLLRSILVIVLNDFYFSAKASSVRIPLLCH